MGPKDKTKISLSDIKKCKQAPLFFNIFLNIQKFLDHELKDPFSNKVSHGLLYLFIPLSPQELLEIWAQKIQKVPMHLSPNKFVLSSSYHFRCPIIGDYDYRCQF